MSVSRCCTPLDTHTTRPFTRLPFTLTHTCTTLAAQPRALTLTCHTPCFNKQQSRPCVYGVVLQSAAGIGPRGVHRHAPIWGDRQLQRFQRCKKKGGWGPVCEGVSGVLLGGGATVLLCAALCGCGSQQNTFFSLACVAACAGLSLPVLFSPSSLLSATPLNHHLLRSIRRVLHVEPPRRLLLLMRAPY